MAAYKAGSTGDYYIPHMLFVIIFNKEGQDYQVIEPLIL